MALAKSKQKKDMDMVHGPLLNKIIIFSIPIVLTALMQQFFHSVDMAVVGKFVGKTELAAVGSNGAIINLLVNIFMGLSAGSTVVIGQLLGGGRIKTAKKAVSTSIILSVISGFIVMLLGVFLSRFFLELISSPPDVIDLATIYLRIYFLGAPFIMVYNFSAAILRSRGQTTKPFFCLLASGLLNIVLNIAFVVVFKWGVAGVAIATVISNALSSSMVIIMLFKDKTELGLKFGSLVFDKYIFSRILRIGLPMAIQSCLFPLSNLLLQSSINSLGTAVMAASAASLSIECYSYAIAAGLDQANVAFVSQNFGARNIKRCKKVFYLCLVLNLAITIIFNILIILFSSQVIGLFTSDPEVYILARKRLIFLYLSFPASVIMNSFTFSLRGLGYSFVPTLVSVIGICGFRVIWILWVFKAFPYFYTILAAFPISWSLVALILIIPFIVIFKKLSYKYPQTEEE